MQPEARRPIYSYMGGLTARGYPAVICLRLLLEPPTRPVRRLGAGMATGAVRADVGVALVRRRASAESTNLVMPSGWEQAPRPATAAADRLATSSASMPPDPSISEASARAMEGRPSLHGPHWPADSPAR